MIALAVVFLAAPALALNDNNRSGYAGLEFYGSSQVTRSELEKDLGLKPGAQLNQIARAVDRLDQKLAQRHLNSNVEIVEGTPQQIFVVVDVGDSATDAFYPTRRLRAPRHVQVSSEKPFLLLDELEARLARLNTEGRPWSESMKAGLKYYNDEPANQIVEQLVQIVPLMRDELIAVTESDPDPSRRKRAIGLLSWAGSIPDTTRRLVPALDDADKDVRAAAARYMFSRFELLPDVFPYDILVESYSHMLNRPSHQDRSKALYCLLALCGQHPELIASAKLRDQAQVRRLSEASMIPSIKNASDQLLARFANPPKVQRRTVGGPGAAPDAGF